MSSVPGVHLGSISEKIETGHRINACNRMWIAVRANTHRGILTTKIRVSRKEREARVPTRNERTRA